MSELPKGYMSTEFTVWCGVCVEWETIPQGTRTRAGKEAKRVGWTYTRKHGWCCPKCSKTNKPL